MVSNISYRKHGCKGAFCPPHPVCTCACEHLLFPTPCSVSWAGPGAATPQGDECPSPLPWTILRDGNRGSLETRLVLGLRQGKEQVKLGYLVVPESNVKE